MDSFHICRCCLAVCRLLLISAVSGIIAIPFAVLEATSPARADEQFQWDGGRFSAEEAVQIFGTQDEEITMDQARAYMLELVNKDRAAEKLQPLTLDDYATKAAQWQADDMALNRYISHWNTEGMTPSMRYTGGGGNDGIGENVTYFECGVKIFLTRKVVEFMEKQFMGSEGHRENLLRPEHNKLGVGIGFALFPDGSCVFTCDQTFVDDYGQMDSLPQSVKLDTPLSISGALDTERVSLRYVGLGWSPFPQKLTRKILNANLQAGEDPGSYNLHAPKGKDAKNGAVPIVSDVEWDAASGKYSLSIDLAKPLENTPMPPDGGGPGTPGVYFVFVWATLKPDLIPSDWPNRDDYYFIAGVWTLGGV